MIIDHKVMEALIIFAYQMQRFELSQELLNLYKEEFKNGESFQVERPLPIRSASDRSSQYSLRLVMEE